MNDRIEQPLIAIMLPLPVLFILLKNFPLCPIRPSETSEHFHLILVIDNYGVVNSRVSQSVTPGTLATIKISPGIAGDVLAPNPQVDVELVGVGRTGTKVSTADDRFTL